MEKKYKITNVSEPANALEEQKAKDSKEFSKAIMKLVASSCSMVIGGELMTVTTQLGSYAPVASAFNAVLIMVAFQVQQHSITKLFNLYNKKYDEETLDDGKKLDIENDLGDLGGKTR